ncbi:MULTISPECIES: IS630 family transposase [Protofrankia]|uniref:IS630 family transposase n=1 Tax=Protofrankia TaxID=2994361 RepID=UPI0002DF8935|nr:MULTISPECIES: IS630 family transposase [Protofrankia]
MSAGPASRCRLDAEQLAWLAEELDRGPAAHDWTVDQRWTLTRIVILIERMFGESYTLTGVAKLLHRMEYSAQRPVHRAVERNEEAIATWRRQVWPQVRQRPRPPVPGSASSTRPARGSRPPKGRGWSRRGRTPVVTVSGRRSPRISIAGMLCVRPGHRPRLIYRLLVHRGHRGEQKGCVATGFTRLVTAAHHQLDGKIVVVWDNLPGHHAHKVRAFIDKHADWLTVHWLPSYAPELNPTEGIWAHLKSGVLANLAALGLDHLIRVTKTALKRIQYRPDLLRGFLAETGLGLEPP